MFSTVSRAVGEKFFQNCPVFSSNIKSDFSLSVSLFCMNVVYMSTLALLADCEVKGINV